MDDLEEYRPVLRRYLARQVAPQEIEDLVQEVFLRVYRAHRRASLSSPQAFIYATARNLVIDHRRRSLAHSEEIVAVEPDRVVAQSADPEELTFLTERKKLLRLAILSLPPRCRQAFVLRKFHDLSYRRIAEKMEVSEKTIEKHLAKALLLCREFLIATERGESPVVDFEHYRRKRAQSRTGLNLDASKTREPS